MKTIFAFFMLAGISLWETEALLGEKAKCVDKAAKECPEVLENLFNLLCKSSKKSEVESGDEKNEHFNALKKGLDCIEGITECTDLYVALEKRLEGAADNIDELTEEDIVPILDLGITEVEFKILCKLIKCARKLLSEKSSGEKSSEEKSSEENSSNKICKLTNLDEFIKFLGKCLPVDIGLRNKNEIAELLKLILCGKNKVLSAVDDIASL